MVGYEVEPDKAVSSSIDLSADIGAEGRKIKMETFFSDALGSAEIAM